MKKYYIIIFSIIFFTLNSHSEELNCVNTRKILYLALQNHVNKEDLSPEFLVKSVKEFLDSSDYYKIFINEKDYKNILNDVKKNKEEYVRFFLKQFNFGVYVNSSFFNSDMYNNTGCYFFEKHLPKIYNNYSLIKERYDLISKQELSEKEKEKYKKFKEYKKRAKNKKEQIARIDYFIKNRLSLESKEIIDEHIKKITSNNKSLLYEKLLNSFLRVCDAHTTYYSNDPEIDETKLSKSLSVENKGFGVEFIVLKNKYPLIKTVLKKSAISELKVVNAGDWVISINGIDLKGKSLNEVDKIFKNSDSAKIKFRTFLDSETFPEFFEDLEFNLTKQKFENNFISSKIKEYSNKKILYISLKSFYYSPELDRGSASDLRDIYLEEISKNKIDGVVLDLRNNTGGYVDEASKLIHIFMGRTIALRVINNFLQEDIIYSAPLVNQNYFDPLIKEPLVVMVNRYSASASEIFAGAIQDYNRGIIVGDDHTYGKGSMQTVVPLDNYGFGEIKITSNLYYLPSGKTPQYSGILSDIEIPSFTDKQEIGEKNSPFSLKPKKPLDNIIEQKNNNFSIKDLNVLKENSKNRIVSNKKFGIFSEKNKSIIDEYILKNLEKINPEDIILEESVQIISDYIDLITGNNVSKIKNTNNEEILEFYDHSGN